MSSLTEKLHASGFIVSEQDITLSRDNGVLILGQNPGAGAVLGKIATSGVPVGAAVAGIVGNGTIGTLSRQTGNQVGVYNAVFVAPTKFEVYDPSGKLIGVGSTGVAFATQVGFTITAGATPFAAGDSFTITVAAGTLKYTQLNLAATDGSDAAAGILIGEVDATNADTAAAVLTRYAEVNSNELVWPAGITAPQKTAALAQLAAFGIVSR